MSISNYWSYYYTSSDRKTLLKNKKFTQNEFDKLLWDLFQEIDNLEKIKQMAEIAAIYGLNMDYTKFNNLAFRNACYYDNIQMVDYLISIVPNINSRILNDTCFVNACWEHRLVASHIDIILVLLKLNPYRYSYSFEKREKKINNFEEEKEARWKTKGPFIMMCMHKNTILNVIPDDLIRIIVDFAYLK
jgi:hypothetical protein